MTTYEQLMLEAFTHYKGGSLQHALKKYKQAALLDIDECGLSLAKSLQGVVLAKLNRLDEAITAFDEGIKALGDSHQNDIRSLSILLKLYVNRGLSYLVRGDEHEARQSLSKALALVRHAPEKPKVKLFEVLMYIVLRTTSFKGLLQDRKNETLVAMTRHHAMFIFVAATEKSIFGQQPEVAFRLLLQAKEVWAKEENMMRVLILNEMLRIAKQNRKPARELEEELRAAREQSYGCFADSRFEDNFKSKLAVSREFLVQLFRLEQSLPSGRSSEDLAVVRLVLRLCMRKNATEVEAQLFSCLPSERALLTSTKQNLELVIRQLSSEGSKVELLTLAEEPDVVDQVQYFCRHVNRLPAVFTRVKRQFFAQLKLMLPRTTAKFNSPPVPTQKQEVSERKPVQAIRTKTVQPQWAEDLWGDVPLAKGLQTKRNEDLRMTGDNPRAKAAQQKLKDDQRKPEYPLALVFQTKGPEDLRGDYPRTKQNQFKRAEQNRMAEHPRTKKGELNFRMTGDVPPVAAQQLYALREEPRATAIESRRVDNPRVVKQRGEEQRETNAGQQFWKGKEGRSKFSMLSDKEDGEQSRFDSILTQTKRETESGRRTDSRRGEEEKEAFSYKPSQRLERMNCLERRMLPELSSGISRQELRESSLGKSGMREQSSGKSGLHESSLMRSGLPRPVSKVDKLQSAAKLSAKQLLNGTKIMKRHLNSDGGEVKVFKVIRNKEGVSLVWGSEQNIKKNKGQGVSLGEILCLHYGKISDNFLKPCNRSLWRENCLTLFLATRTLDLYFMNEEFLKDWVVGLSYLIYSNRLEKPGKSKEDKRPPILSYYTEGRYLWKRMKLKAARLYIEPLKHRKYFNEVAESFRQMQRVSEKEAARPGSTRPPELRPGSSLSPLRRSHMP